MTVRKQRETQNLYTGSTDALSFPLTRDLSHTLGDGRGETFFSQGFAKDAAAAYSLRALGSYNEPVVRVRREPHDEDGAINDEQNFTASQVSGGELENWVNGKLEDTLPADVATAAAAYSLRKVKDGYSGDAVRIRRSSDDIEVNVAFDSDGKVSASSAITNVSEQGGEIGSTTTTTLGDFLGQTSITTGVAEMAQGDSSALSNATTTGFTLTQTGSLIGAMFPFSSNIGAGTKVTMTFTLSEDSGNASSSFRLFSTTGLGNAGSPATIERASPGTYTIEFEATAEARGIGFFDNVSGSVVTISNASITIENSAFVHTWYDQAGSNDAVQATAADQPKIAENGALITNNSKPAISFAGNDARLSTSRFLTSQGNTYFAVYDVTNSLYPTQAGIIFRQGKNYRLSMSILNASDGHKIRTQARDGGGDQARADTSSSFDGQTILQASIVSATRDANGLKTFVNSANEATADTTDVQDVDFSTVDDGSNPNDNAFYIGSINTGIYDFLGNLQEIILFNTDESDNRFKIESNINNYYGLYNDGNDLTQTEWQATGAESFSSTSTDGFSYSNSSSTAFIGVTLKETLALNDSVFVSFNASGVDIPDESPQIRLRDSVSGGSATSNLIGVVQNGFNSFELEYTTGANGQNIVFSEGDTGGGTVTISDFKVSRIARNGFVETWYDQSGNGNDATQGTAGKQPQIVINGGQVIETQGKPAIGFQQTDTSFGNQEFLNTTSDVSVQAMYATLSIKDTNDDEQTVVGHASDNNKFIAILKQAANPSSAPRVRETSTDLKYSAPSDAELDTGIVFSYNRNASNNNVVRINNGNSAITSGTDTNLNTDIVIQMVGARTGGLDSWRGKMQEVILFDRDTEDDRADLQNDMANFYNITLS